MLGEGFKMLHRMVREVLPKKGSQDLKESRPETASQVKSWERAFQEGKASAKVLRQQCVWGVRDCCNNRGKIKCGMTLCGSSRVKEGVECRLLPRLVQMVSGVVWI